jgi:hypothetical protein
MTTDGAMTVPHTNTSREREDERREQESRRSTTLRLALLSSCLDDLA